jgi:hypothetical protein
MKDGISIKEFYNTADVWMKGDESIKIKLDNPGEFDRIVLGSVEIPDVNNNDNELQLAN